MSNLPEHHEDHPQVITRNARRGLALFRIYLALYLAFLFINVFSPETMTQTSILLPFVQEPVSLGGPNLAIVSGIGLIFTAIVLSLIYMRLTKAPSSAR